MTFGISVPGAAASGTKFPGLKPKPKAWTCSCGQEHPGYQTRCWTCDMTRPK